MCTTGKMSTSVKHMLNTRLTHKKSTHVQHIKRAHVLSYVVYIRKTYFKFNMCLTYIEHISNTC